jgi:hypothetical protein
MTKVINIKHKKDTKNEVYIGRGSPFGNPVVIGKMCPICNTVHKDRGSTLDCYKIWLSEALNDCNFKEQVKDLYGKTLVCFCKPLPCHGDILAYTAEILYDSDHGIFED